MRVTREQVAKHAGVSVATVSYVLNNSRKMTEKTRNKVLKSIDELGYKPDLIARSMVTNETMQLSMIVNNIENPFYGEIILGFESAALEKGYFVNICTGEQNIDDYLENFIARRVDGIFVAALPNKFNMEKLYRLVDAGIKVVVSGNVEADLKKVSSIENDHYDSMEKAVKYLYGLGHRDIAYITGLSKNQTFETKIAGFLAAKKKMDILEDDSLLVDGFPPYRTTSEEGYDLANKLIESKRKFTAIICTNDLMAFGCIKALKEKGFEVPRDVSVLSFDDISMSAMWDPPLTTMSVEKRALGEKAFELLYTNMKTGSTGYFLSKINLIERESTGRCRG